MLHERQQANLHRLNIFLPLQDSMRTGCGPHWPPEPRRGQKRNALVLGEIERGDLARDQVRLLPALSALLDSTTLHKGEEQGQALLDT